MARPVVSVIVSAYNRPIMLRAAVASVQCQTYQDLEILIQDDSTNDECQKVVHSLSDERIRYSRNRPSLGTSLNLLAGYKNSHGKYFCTLNDDDLYDPDYIETMVSALEGNPSYSLACSDHYVIDEKGEIKADATEENSRMWGRSHLNEGNVENPLKVAILFKSIPGMFALFRKESVDLDDFPPEVSSGYDYWLTYLAVRNGNPVFYTPKRLTYYRVHEGNQTFTFSDPHERLRFFRYCQFMDERFLADSRLKNVHSMLTPRLARTHSSAGLAWLRLSNKSEAFLEFVESCKLRPSISAIFGMLLCGLPTSAIRLVIRNTQ